MTTRQSEQAHGALKTLEAMGFDVKTLWTELALRVEEYERAEPMPFDERYLAPAEAPAVGEQFGKDRAGKVINGKGEVVPRVLGENPVKPQVLAAQVLWKGYHYSLTPGQRRWFREQYNLTPAETVTVTEVVLWPGSRRIRMFKFVSDTHIDPRNRRHVLTEAWVRKPTPAEFFDKAAQYDAEEVEKEILKLREGPVNVWRACHRWAVEDCGGPKMKNGDKVRIVDLTPDTITFEEKWMVGESPVVTVGRKDFLGYVTDYENGTRRRETASAKRPDGQPKKPALSLDELMANLAQGVLPE